MSLITIAVVASHRIHDLPNLLRLPEHAPVDDCIDRRLGCIILVPEGERSIQREPSILGVNVLPYCVHPIDLRVVEIERRVGRAGKEVPHRVPEREVAAAMGPEAVDVRRVRGEVTLELDDVARVQELVYDVLVAEAGRDVVLGRISRRSYAVLQNRGSISSKTSDAFELRRHKSWRTAPKE